ncbi:hypothetical protein J7M02_06640, partial [Candidatus Aerophobetes bacterium]|nr:hypothetical protein [Candidatus Aerophobetes bacterium]
MDKNIILAIVLSVVVLVIYNLFFLPKAVVPPEREKKISPPVEEKTPLPSTEVQEFYLENPQVKLVFSSQGGVIKSWYLKDKKKEVIREGDDALNISLFLPEEGKIDLRNKIFQVEEEKNKKIIFSWEDKDKKIKIIKTIEIPKQGYQIQANLSLKNFPLEGQYQLSWPTVVGKKAGGEERLAFWQNALYREKEEGV